MLAAPPFSLLDNLNTVDDAIDTNADLAEEILELGLQAFGVPNFANQARAIQLAQHSHSQRHRKGPFDRATVLPRLVCRRKRRASILHCRNPRRSSRKSAAELKTCTCPRRRTRAPRPRLDNKWLRYHRQRDILSPTARIELDPQSNE